MQRNRGATIKKKEQQTRGDRVLVRRFKREKKQRGEKIGGKRRNRKNHTQNEARRNSYKAVEL